MLFCEEFIFGYFLKFEYFLLGTKKNTNDFTKQFFFSKYSTKFYKISTKSQKFTYRNQCINGEILYF